MSVQHWLKKLESVAGRMTTGEAALFLGLSVRTLELWRQKGLGPKYLRLGHSIRYDIDDLNAYLRSCQSGSEPAVV